MEAMIKFRPVICELLRELLTEYIKSEQYTLELLMSEQTNLYKEVEDEEIREIGIYGFHYASMASQVYGYLGELTDNILYQCITLCVDACALAVFKDTSLDTLPYIIVSNKQYLKSVDIFSNFRGYRMGHYKVLS